MAEPTRQLKDPIYDPDSDKPVTRPDLAKKEQVSSVPAEQLERIPTMSDEEAAALDEKRGLSGDSLSRKELASKEQGTIHENPVGSGYREIIGNKLNNSKRLRNYAIAAGIGSAIVTIIIIIFSFLNIFKLDGMMSNIEQKAFLRHNASLNTRSSKWISSYVEARMLQFGDNPSKNGIFRATRVDTNSPFSDWYRTLRTSSFEQDVFEKHGIKFVSYLDENGRPRPGRIDINGEKPITAPLSNQDIQNIMNGEPGALSKYEDYLNLDKFDSNKDARKAIKKVVNDNTHWFQIHKRRFLRRSIQNMTGVRDWRFFETTRDKISDKKVDIRNRVLDKMLPDDNLLGKVARCFYGLSKCKSTRDTGDPDIKVDAETLASEDTKDQTPQDQKDREGKLEGELVDDAGISEALKKVLAAANIATRILNIPQTLDMLSNVDNAVRNLTKLIVVARGAQAAGLFQVFETSRDQIKTGQVSGDEVNAFMQVIGTAGSSAGWSQVVNGDGKNPPGTEQTGGQCSQEAQALQEKQPQVYERKYGDYAPLCADQRINAAANAQKIQTSYNDTIGPVLGPIVNLWGNLKSGILGPVIGLLEWFGNLLNGVFATLFNTLMSALGLQGKVNAFITWVFAKTSNFLGLTILKGYESAGTIFNWLVQGGAYSAESSSRQEGAALTTPASKVAAQNAIAQYKSDQQQEMSLYDKVASLDNPDSLAFKGATALSNLQSDPSGSVIASMHGIWGSLSHNFGSIFIPELFAATPSGYAASQFAGIETYDYPQQCYDLDPITAAPIDGTNALAIFQQNKLTVPQEDSDALNTWVTERSSTAFFKVVYDVLKQNGIVDNADDIATHIYNCNLLDTAVRGSLGYLYGYNADAADQVIEGPDNSNGASSGDFGSGDAGPSGNLYGSSVNVPCDPRTHDLKTQTGYRNGSPIEIRVCALPNLPSSGEESIPGNPYYINGANGQAVVNSVYSKNFYDLVEAAKSNGVTMYANSAFRTMAHQQALCRANSLCSSGSYTLVAQPGTSNHQMGLAIDFGTQSHALISAGDTWYNWLSANAAKFTVSNYPAEAWHWSADGH